MDTQAQMWAELRQLREERQQWEQEILRLRARWLTLSLEKEFLLTHGPACPIRAMDEAEFEKLRPLQLTQLIDAVAYKRYDAMNGFINAELVNMEGGATDADYHSFDAAAAEWSECTIDQLTRLPLKLAAFYCEITAHAQYGGHDDVLGWHSSCEFVVTTHVF